MSRHRHAPRHRHFGPLPKDQLVAADLAESKGDSRSAAWLRGEASVLDIEHAIMARLHPAP